jgi:glycosyltransferase involved in cell wall biosynthesis
VGVDKMTTCLLVSAPFGGVEVHFRLLARELAASDRIDHLDAIWLKYQPQEVLSRLPPFRWNWYSAAALSTMRQYAALRKSGSAPDVALFNQVNPALFLDPFARLPPVVLQLDTTPLVTASMGHHYRGRANRRPAVERIKLDIYRRTFRQARHLIAVSQLVRHSLVEDYRVEASKISVIPFSIDTHFFSRQPDSPSRTDVLRVLFVGGEFQRKGGELLLDAARLPEFANCEFHVVTKGDVRDAPANVFVHRDVPPNSDRLRDLLASASIFALPTLADLSPVALLEAMAMELPVLTTDVGGIPEIVLDDRTGYVIPPADSRAFVERLRALVDSPATRLRMGVAGRSKAEADHSIQSNVLRYLDILESR